MVGIVSLAFGLVTPPYGLCLMISCAIAKVRMVYVLKDVMIMLLPMLGVLSLTILWPDLILFLPKLISPEFSGRPARLHADAAGCPRPTPQHDGGFNRRWRRARCAPPPCRW
jgi:hypothetical protein